VFSGASIAEGAAVNVEPVAGSTAARAGTAAFLAVVAAGASVALLKSQLLLA
jgi:hypothetical protein